jgi:hypothetical protein
VTVLSATVPSQLIWRSPVKLTHTACCPGKLRQLRYGHARLPARFRSGVGDSEHTLRHDLRDCRGVTGPKIMAHSSSSRVPLRQVDLDRTATADAGADGRPPITRRPGLPRSPDPPATTLVVWCAIWQALPTSVILPDSSVHRRICLIVRTIGRYSRAFSMGWRTALTAPIGEQC